MNVGGERRIGKEAIGDDRVRCLLKKEGPLALGIAAHLARMLGIVASDAIKPPHREKAAGAHHWHRRQGSEIHHIFMDAFAEIHVSLIPLSRKEAFVAAALPERSMARQASSITIVSKP